ncbi:MAG: hypothetical protein ABR991_01105, partial [Terracidiphilus sp.]
RLSPPVSSALNLLMIALLALGLYRHTVFPAGGVHTILFRALGCGAVAVWMAVIAPLLPRILSPLRMDRPWPARWLPQVEIHTEGAHLIVFLKPDCPACQAWAKALGRLSVTPELSAVTIITPGNSQAAASLSRAARTPVVQGGLVRSWLMAPEVPMAVIVRGGTICEIWSKTLPETWVRRLRRSPAEISIME